MVRKIFVILGFWVYLVGWAQTTESDKLLNQANRIVFQQPQEALAISLHVAKMADDVQIKSHALYVSALAEYVMGDYEGALQDAFAGIELGTEDSKTENLLKELVNQILDDLELSFEQNPFNRQKSILNPLIKGKKNLIQLEQNLQEGKLSREDLVERSNELQDSGFLSSQFLKILGDYEFEQKNLPAAIENYESALSFAQKVKNPFLEEKITQQLARTYLVFNDLEKFHKYTNLSNLANQKTSQIENRTLGLADQLFNEYFNLELKHLENNLKFIGYVLLGVFLILLVLKLVLFYQNREKIKAYQLLLKYLQEDIQPKEVSVQVKQKETEVSLKPSILQKESEDYILQGLQKFESSKKFTHKDMSLSMLASQLNTNTKYLSEVINRHKGKNFNAYINDLRIRYIIHQIQNNPQYLNYKVSYLAEECGFSSHSTFTTVFKSIVGVSPIQFLDFVKEETKKENYSKAV